MHAHGNRSPTDRCRQHRTGAPGPYTNPALSACTRQPHRTGRGCQLPAHRLRIPWCPSPSGCPESGPRVGPTAPRRPWPTGAGPGQRPWPHFPNDLGSHSPQRSARGWWYRFVATRRPWPASAVGRPPERPGHGNPAPSPGLKARKTDPRLACPLSSASGLRLTRPAAGVGFRPLASHDISNPMYREHVIRGSAESRFQPDGEVIFSLFPVAVNVTILSVVSRGTQVTMHGRERSVHRAPAPGRRHEVWRRLISPEHPSSA